MPTGKYKKTEIHKKKLSKSLLGHNVSLRTRKKISINTKKAMNRPEVKIKIKNRKSPYFTNEWLLHLSQSQKGHTRTRKKSELQAIISGEALCWAKYRKIRKEILKRDNYLCQICGKEGNQTHHIKSRKKFPELFFKKQNIITICRSCHIKEDKIIEIRWKKYKGWE